MPISVPQNVSFFDQILNRTPHQKLKSLSYFYRTLVFCSICAGVRCIIIPEIYLQHFPISVKVEKKKKMSWKWNMSKLKIEFFSAKWKHAYAHDNTKMVIKPFSLPFSVLPLWFWVQNFTLRPDSPALFCFSFKFNETWWSVNC